MLPIELARYYCSKMNPFAPPDRRFKIAKTCHVRGVNPSYCRDDQPTWDIWKFLKRCEAAYEPQQRARLLMAHPGLSAAFQLHHGKMRQLRPVIEAYIVAGESDASIAKRLAVPTDAIGWFRLAFYDIEHLRDAPLRIVHQLIGIGDENGQSALDLHRLWKLIGYKLKSQGLDELFFNARDDGETFKAGGLAAWLPWQAVAVLASKQLIAMSNLNADDPKHVATLLKLLLQQQRSQSESEAASLNALDQHINGMLSEIPWTSGALAKEAYKDTAVGAWDERAAELRDEELQLLAAGEEVPGLDELKDLDSVFRRDRAATDTPGKDGEK